MENYEQKYKAALNWMRNIYPTLQGTDREDAEHYFPELKESEDERIRKGLIKGLSAMRDIHKHQTFSDDAIDINDAIAWLEKQGELIYSHPMDTKSTKRMVKRISKQFLDLARKELEKDNVIIDKDKYLEICDQYYNNGKKNALEDLPKWRKNPSREKETMYGMSAISDIYYKGYFIHLDDIYKALPKEG